MTPWVRGIRMVRALQGQVETFGMYFRMGPPMFPSAFSRRRVCGWSVYPGCHSLCSLCPGLGSFCPFGAHSSYRTVKLSLLS